jgi:hypothetical protein
MKGTFDMKLHRTHLMAVAAALSTIAIAAPVSTAGAATTHHVADAAPGTVTGSTYITTAPTTFVNLNNQVSDANTSLGNQTA